ncbi:hypothetical protein [Paenibacillus puerhi]|uniref:hypothetical protein n=1 Tax=Paenibacillus puerhi TaxID=2692622 RepID=UPI00135B0ACA|nr:hypothetical protein [Paenibacillus puerhi]
MSYLLELNIAEHRLAVELPSETIYTWALRTFSAVPATSYTFASRLDMIISVNMGYGSPKDSRLPQIRFTADRIRYSQSDLLITASRDCSEAAIEAYDESALEYALILLYNALITQREWGLIVGASTIAEGSKAYLFMLPAGRPEAGFLPPPPKCALLSDEVAILKVSGGEVRAFNSPFRKGTCRQPEDIHLTCEVGAYYSQRPSPLIRHSPVGRTDAVQQLQSCLYLKPLDPSDTTKTIAMCRKAIEKVPFYELYAPTHDLFWQDMVASVDVQAKHLQHG